MNDRVHPDGVVPGAFIVEFGQTQQSWVDPERPDYLVFEYVQHIAMLLDHSALRAPTDRRLRVVHLGGGGLTLPRWVAWRRPATAQVVCEPDVELTAEVRRKVPLGRHSGIKVRDVDARTGVAAMPDDWADVVILDAFDQDHVPAELVTREFLEQVRRIQREDCLLIANVTDLAPFDWAKRVAAGLVEGRPRVVVGAEPSVLKGRRFGNLVFAASVGPVDLAGVRRESAKLPSGYRWLDGRELTGWIGGAEPWTDADARPSPRPTRIW
ncbi:spermidine synthase [Tessaracoccus caeni]|uniref:spermidine synthase n=1 Tax=Tessaracoccus caeni TaxID=3031239 RepID=UPI0023DAE5C9|nr:fused MFS/spermidine synthase [Tessaracoccus caeni]MDF1489246.1 fused MFS/spermidine synthase [Tessaracoccus caeni]